MALVCADAEPPVTHEKHLGRARYRVRRLVNLQLVAPLLSLPSLRHELQIVNPIAGLLTLDLVFHLPLESGLGLVSRYFCRSAWLSSEIKVAAANTQNESRTLFARWFRTIIDSPLLRVQRLAHAGILTVLSVDRRRDKEGSRFKLSRQFLNFAS